MRFYAIFKNKNLLDKQYISAPNYDLALEVAKEYATNNHVELNLIIKSNRSTITPTLWSKHSENRGAK